MAKETLDIITEIDLAEANVTLRSNGIVYVFLKENCVLDVDLQLRLLDVYIKITEGKLTPFLFMADAGVSITKEARDNAVSLEDRSPLVATAVVVTNLAYRLIANFYLQFHKPKRPYKVFNNNSEAVEWLKTFIN